MAKKFILVTRVAYDDIDYNIFHRTRSVHSGWPNFLFPPLWAITKFRMRPTRLRLVQTCACPGYIPFQFYSRRIIPAVLLDRQPTILEKLNSYIFHCLLQFFQMKIDVNVIGFVLFTLKADETMFGYEFSVSNCFV